MRRSAPIIACLLLVFTSAVAAENWPQWRGPNSQGVSRETQVPTEWGPDRNIAWKVALPHGHSSPIVWGDRIFLTAAIEGEQVPGVVPESVRINQPHPDSVAGDRKHTLKVLALDVKTGKTLWEQTAYEGTMFDARHRRSSFAGPTAVTDGRMVYAYFGPEGLYAYDVNGKLAWSVVEKFHTLGLGTGTSPVLFGDTVIIQRDQDPKTSVVVAYDKATGKEVWKTERPVQISWSTPVLVEASGRTELVTNGTEHVIAYDAATGKELWRTAGVRSNAIHTPLVGKGMVVVTAGFPAKRTIAIRTGEQPDDRRVAWEFTKGTAYVLSNILYDGQVYLSTDNGIVTALDAETGKIIYEGGRPPKPTHFMGSAIAFNGLIAMTSEEGETFLLKAGPKHEIVRVNTIDEPVYTSAAVANGRIYIRGDKHLFAIGK
ncbi:MAG TPA: PQQ-binding-like beta-propeller repeat protein [Vicinamibacterales bacterium]|nr:PQQ-binding-like beta-propeller repeat protein [Vicinamibacterales bacterium]